MNFDASEPQFLQVEDHQRGRHRTNMGWVDVKVRGENRQAFGVRRFKYQQTVCDQLFRRKADKFLHACWRKVLYNLGTVDSA